jgi:transcriptional regulator with XRE-family HTH domain
MNRVHPLKEFRERQIPPLTQDQLADLLGVSKASVSRWESGARKVDQELLPKVSDRTGISPSELRPDIADLMKRKEAAE